GQIHTSFHAGGIASARMRSSVSASSTRPPAASTYSNPRPRRRRLIPGRLQSARRRRLTSGETAASPLPFRPNRKSVPRDLLDDVPDVLLFRLERHVGCRDHTDELP